MKTVVNYLCWGPQNGNYEMHISYNEESMLQIVLFSLYIPVISPFRSLQLLLTVKAACQNLPQILRFFPTPSLPWAMSCFCRCESLHVCIKNGDPALPDVLRDMDEHQTLRSKHTCTHYTHDPHILRWVHLNVQDVSVRLL